MTLGIFLIPFCHLSYRGRVDERIGDIVAELSKHLKVFSYSTVCSIDGVPRLLKEDFAVILAGSRGIEPLLEEYSRVNSDVCTVVLVAERLCGLAAVKNFYASMGHVWPLVIGVDGGRIADLLKICSRIRRGEVGVVDGYVIDRVMDRYKGFIETGEREARALYLALRDVSKGLDAVAVNMDRLNLATRVPGCSALTMLDEHVSTVSYPNRLMARLKYIVDGFSKSLEAEVAWMDGDTYELKVCVGDLGKTRFNGATVVSIPRGRLRVLRGNVLAVSRESVTLELDGDPEAGEVLVIPSRDAADLLEELKYFIDRELSE